MNPFHFTTRKSSEQVSKNIFDYMLECFEKSRLDSGSKQVSKSASNYLSEFIKFSKEHFTKTYPTNVVYLNEGLGLVLNNNITVYLDCKDPPKEQPKPVKVNNADVYNFSKGIQPSDSINITGL